MKIDRLIRDANASNPYACLALGYYYHTGKEFDFDIATAVKWYEKAAAGGCARAHWELAKLYRDGDLVLRNLPHYIEHLKESATLGNVDAQLSLANEYREGLLLEQDNKMSMEWYRKAAENGNNMAKFMVGYFYAHGIGAPRSKVEAEVWYSSVSVSGDGDLFLEIGMNYEYGMNGIAHNEVEAGRWYMYGSDMGHEKCTLCWASVLNGLDGGQKETYDERMGRLLTTKTQKETTMRDDALAMADEFFEAGDEKRAFTYYERAAGLGSHEAMFIIAMLYHQGIYVKRDDRKAFDILKRAASAGSPDAQFFLGRMYDGNGMPKDESQAIEYYTQAAANGFLAAYYYLGRYMDRPEVHVRRMVRR